MTDTYDQLAAQAAKVAAVNDREAFASRNEWADAVNNAILSYLSVAVTIPAPAAEGSAELADQKALAKAHWKIGTLAQTIEDMRQAPLPVAAVVIMRGLLMHTRIPFDSSYNTGLWWDFTTKFKELMIHD